DRDARNRFERAVDRHSIGMTREGRRPPVTARHVAQAHGLPLQPRYDLRPYPIDRLGIKARFGQRQPEIVEGLVAMILEGAQGAAKIVASGTEAEFDRLALEPVMEGLGVERARSFVEQAR